MALKHKNIMHTTITKRLKSSEMDVLFNSRDKINIRLCQAKNYDESQHTEDTIYSYEIVVRHNEDEDADELFKKALKSIQTN